jgi:putative hydrolase
VTLDYHTGGIAMLYDFHTHSFFSDGELLPMELIRRAIVNGYVAIGVTDHAGPGNLERVVGELVRECRLAEKHWQIIAVPGVELTHVPPASIAELTRDARRFGAELVVVHGETLAEPVEKGTNRAALISDVDILAHPGLLNEEEALLALENGVFLELSARGGHNAANGNVVKAGRTVGASFLINSDTHSPSNLLTEKWARDVALGAGLSEEEAEQVLTVNPLQLLERIRYRRGQS